MTDTIEALIVGNDESLTCDAGLHAINRGVKVLTRIVLVGLQLVTIKVSMLDKYISLRQLSIKL